MNEFDQFVKHDLKVAHYARYTDDFVIIAQERAYLENLLQFIRAFLSDCLKLSLHPDKMSIQSQVRGVDFLGYVAFPHHSLLRTKTRKRIWKKLRQRVSEYKTGFLSEEVLYQSVRSYLGVLSHANALEVSEQLKNQFWFWMTE